MKLTPGEKHLAALAKRILRLSNSAALILGGMSKDAAREFLNNHGFSIDEIIDLER